jgi:hypothetical protein
MSPANVAPHFGAKDPYYCTVYSIILYSICEAQRISKNLKTMVEDRFKVKINVWLI